MVTQVKVLKLVLKGFEKALQSMAEKKKNLCAFTRNHPEIPLLTNLPPGVKRNQNKKRYNFYSTWVPRSNLSP